MTHPPKQATKVPIFFLGAAMAVLLPLGCSKEAPPEPEPSPVVEAPPPIPTLDERTRRHLRTTATEDFEGEVRWPAAELLFKMEDRDSLIILQDMVARDPEYRVRMNALNTLASLDDPTVIPILWGPWLTPGA